MLIYNKSMKKYIKKAKRKRYAKRSLLLQCRKTIYNEPFYCIKNGFCFDMHKIVTDSGEKLSSYEWEGNEYYMTTNHLYSKLIVEGIWMCVQIKNEMKYRFQEVNFEVVLIANRNSCFDKSIQIRLCKIRDNYHSPIEDIGGWKQPVLKLVG